MSSQSVNSYSARNWHRRWGHLNWTDVVRNAPETVGELDHVCALAHITKNPVTRWTETQADEKLERVFTDVIRTFRVEWPSGSALCLQTSTRFSLGEAEDVFLRFRHSTGEDHTRNAITVWVSWEFQQDATGDGEMLSGLLNPHQNDSSCDKDQKHVWEKRRKMRSRSEARYKT